MSVAFVAGTARSRAVKRPTLFETPYVLPQLRIFDLDEPGWSKALKVGEYALRRPRRPQTLQDRLFTYTEIL